MVCLSRISGHMGGCQKYGPWGSLIYYGTYYLGYPKRDPNFDIYPYHTRSLQAPFVPRSSATFCALRSFAICLRGRKRLYPSDRHGVVLRQVRNRRRDTHNLKRGQFFLRVGWRTAVSGFEFSETHGPAGTIACDCW